MFSREVVIVVALPLEVFEVWLGQYKFWSKESLCMVKRTRLEDTDTNWAFVNSDAAMSAKGVG